jgi:hypothetical protein
MELDRVPLWRGDSAAIKQLVDDFARYLYLPRLADPSVLLNAIRDGLPLLTWEEDSFAFADSYDDEGRRYRGLRGGQQVMVRDSDAPGLLVRSEVARRQLSAETPRADGSEAAASGPVSTNGDVPGPEQPGTSSAVGRAQPRRFHGTVALDPMRVGRDASRVADEVIAHLAGLLGANLNVKLEIDVDIPSGAPDNVVRTVTENARTLKFEEHGFECD